MGIMSCCLVDMGPCVVMDGGDVIVRSVEGTFLVIARPIIMLRTYRTDSLGRNLVEYSYRQTGQVGMCHISTI